MTVEQLIEELKKQPPEAVVVVDFDCESSEAYTIKVDGTVSIREMYGAPKSRRKYIALTADDRVGTWRN